MRNRHEMISSLVLMVCIVPMSCAGPNSSLRRTDCPTAPVPAADLQVVEGIRARVHITSNGRSVGLEAVARFDGSELIVVGIAQYGLRLFVIRQRDGVLGVEGTASREVERLAAWTLDAIHRAFWISRPPDALAGTVLAWDRGHERVTEFTGDALRRREFTRRRYTHAAVVRYPTEDASSYAEILNPWCGYEAVVAVLEPSREGPNR